MDEGPKPKHFAALINEQDLKHAAEIAELGELDDAWDIVNARLLEAPNDISALVLATSIQCKAKRLPIAYQLARAAVREAPKLSAAWMNLGHCAEQLYQEHEALRAYRTAIKLHPAHKVKAKGLLLTNYSSLLLQMGRWEEGEQVAREAFACDQSRKASGNLGIALLAQHKWEEGWRAYQAVRNTDQARGYSYGVPEWTGEPNQTVVIHGEQGIGDEICFASMIPDMIAHSKRVIVDCEPKLANLFQRSFPQAKVYGTRWKKELGWAAKDRVFDASLAIGALGRYFRSATESFPCVPYLKPDPQRLEMWQALFGKLNKPVIGVAWTGGVQWTNEQFRKITMSQLAPLFQAINAHWVCLQYKDANEEIQGTPLHQYPWATLTNDYDDTAGLVASLDAVITVPTSVAHLAGALGVPTVAMKASHGCWKYAAGLPFHPATIVEHAGNWEHTLEHAVEALRGITSATSIHRIRHEAAASA